MGILSGFIKTKRYRKTDSGYKIQSEWTHSDTVEMSDGTTLTEKMASHSHSDVRSTDNTYTLAIQGDGNVVLYNNSDDTVSAVWAMNAIVNSLAKKSDSVFTTSDPGVGATVSYADGTFICVYE